MADFWSQYKNDFPDLGGFQQQPPGFSNSLTPTAPNLGQMPLDSGFADSPRVTTQPQPYQQGPGGLIGSLPEWMQNKSPGIDRGGEILTDEQRQQRDQQLNDMFQKMGGKIQPGPYGREWTPGGGPGTLQGPMDMQHIMGTIGAGAGGIGNMMRGQPMNPAQQDVARQALPSGGAFGGGIAIGPNGGFINPGDGSPYQGGMSAMGPQQPMNPGQQSGQVQMQAPDGTMQYVNQEHVPHYQGLGAQVYNGSSYGSGQ